MKLNEYKKETLRTFAYRQAPLDEQTTDLLHCAIGFATEISELKQAINKRDYTNIGEEIADGMWYVVNMANFLNYDLETYIFQQPMSYYNERDYFDNHLILSGEILDIFKKSIYYNQRLNTLRLKELVYECLHNANCLCKVYSLNFQIILKRNIEKLRIRFPEKFSEQCAVKRELSKEREALEGYENVFFGILDIGDKFEFELEFWQKLSINKASNRRNCSVKNFEEKQIVKIKTK